MSAGLHDKHRDRVRKEFLAHGFDETTPLHKVVEMLLFYSIPRKDTNELAHILVEKFGTLEKILSARPEELMEIQGIGENTIAHFKLLRYAAKSYIGAKSSKIKKFNSADEIFQFVTDKYFDTDREIVAITSFDGAGRLLGFDVIGEGDIALVGVSVRDILEVAFKRKAVSVILSHNHPNGTALPSDADITTTQKIYNILSDANVILLDHIIVADGDYVSLVQSNEYRYIFTHLKR